MNDFKIEVKNLPKSEASIEVSFPFKLLAPYREKAIGYFQEHLDLPGFRKGKIPEKILVEKVGELKLAEEMLELLVAERYADIIAKAKVNALGQPTISVKKIAPGNPVEINIKVAVVPEVKLPDYKKIASEVPQVKVEPVSDKDFEKALTDLRERIKVGMGMETLPELTDELVKQVGDFASLEDFKKKFRESLNLEREREAREKHRLGIADKLIGATALELPGIIIGSETQRMIERFKTDLARMNIKLADYLKRLGQSEEVFSKEHRASAERSAKLDLILDAIASAEKITPTDEMVAEEVKHLKEHHPEADETRLRVSVVGHLENELVFQFLEKQSH